MKNDHKDIGAKFKAIRKQRGLTIQQLSEIAGSNASISDFENGKSSLSMEVLLSLTAEMCVNFDELVIQRERYEKLISLESNIQDELLYGTEQSFKDCISEIDNTYHTTQNRLYWILAASCKVLGMEQYGWSLSESFMNKIRDYFFSIEIWTVFDIAQFGLLVEIFNNKSLFLLSRELIDCIQTPPRNGFDRVLIDTILETISVLLKRREKKYSDILINLIETCDMPLYFMYQISRTKFLRCVWKYYFYDSIHSLDEANAILLSVETLISKAVADSWATDFL